MIMPTDCSGSGSSTADWEFSKEKKKKILEAATIFGLIYLSTGGHLSQCKFLFNPARWQLQSPFWSHLSWQTSLVPSRSFVFLFFWEENNLSFSVMIQTPSLCGVGLIALAPPPQETDCHIFFPRRKLTAGGWIRQSTQQHVMLHGVSKNTSSNCFQYLFHMGLKMGLSSFTSIYLP